VQKKKSHRSKRKTSRSTARIKTVAAKTAAADARRQSPAHAVATNAAPQAPAHALARNAATQAPPDAGVAKAATRAQGHAASNVASTSPKRRSNGPITAAPLRDTSSAYRKARTVAAALICIGSTALTLMASVNDFTAFTAAATPAVYAWVGLCVVCAIGVGVVNRSYDSGLRVPAYFHVVLLLGVAGGLLSVPDAVHVLRKATAPPNVPMEGQPSDWRGKSIARSSFVGKDLRGAQAQHATFLDVDFSHANLAESDLRFATLIDVRMSRVDLCGADLRNADLRLVTGLSDVRDWSYTFYNGRTRFPHGFHIANYTGPIPDSGRGLLYSCSPGSTRRIAR
jgi:Pentapeptide repeats (8 copies)